MPKRLQSFHMMAWTDDMKAWMKETTSTADQRRRQTLGVYCINAELGGQNDINS